MSWPTPSPRAGRRAHPGLQCAGNHHRAGRGGRPGAAGPCELRDPRSPRPTGTAPEGCLCRPGATAAGRAADGGALALSGLDPARRSAAALPAALGTWRFWLALIAIVEIADQMTPSSVAARTGRRRADACAACGARRGGGLAVAPGAAARWWRAILQAGLLLASYWPYPLLESGTGRGLLARQCALPALTARPDAYDTVASRIFASRSSTRTSTWSG